MRKDGLCSLSWFVVVMSCLVLTGCPTERGPAITSFSLNENATFTPAPTVTLDHACSGTPSHYMASESGSFAGASWLVYEDLPTFALSAGNGAKTVYFKVKNGSGESAVVSDSITFDAAMASQAPAAPTNLQIALDTQAASQPAIRLTWKDNSNGGAGGNELEFVVERRRYDNVEREQYGVVATVPGESGGNGTRTWTDQGLAYATHYTYRVRARNWAGYSGYTGEQKLALGNHPGPGAPTGALTLRVSLSSGTSALLEWSDALREDGYRIEYKVQGNWALICGLQADLTYIYIDDLVQGSTYTFRIVAVNDFGTKASNSADITVPAAPGATLKVYNDTPYDLIEIRLDNQNILSAGQVVQPGYYLQRAGLSAGTHSLYVGIGVGDDEYFNRTNNQLVLTTGQTKQENVTLRAQHVVAGTWWGWEPATFPNFVEHRIEFYTNGGFTRSKRVGTGAWTNVQSGSIVNASWLNYSPIISFNLGAGGAYTSTQMPFASLFARIGDSGGAVQLNRQD